MIIHRGICQNQLLHNFVSFFLLFVAPMFGVPNLTRRQNPKQNWGMLSLSLAFVKSSDHSYLVKSHRVYLKSYLRFPLTWELSYQQTTNFWGFILVPPLDLVNFFHDLITVNYRLNPPSYWLLLRWAEWLAIDSRFSLEFNEWSLKHNELNLPFSYIFFLVHMMSCDVIAWSRWSWNPFGGFLK